MRDAWTEVVENKKTIYRTFEKTGISLKTDGSEDGEKMYFQGQPVGVPEGLVYMKLISDISLQNETFAYTHFF